jgi:hypothetical protein
MEGNAHPGQFSKNTPACLSCRIAGESFDDLVGKAAQRERHVYLLTFGGLLARQIGRLLREAP